METVIAPRASTILYDLLVSMRDRRTFLLPANICSIVPLTFLKAGTPFEFVDISPETLHMDLEQVQTSLRPHKTDVRRPFIFPYLRRPSLRPLSS